MAEARGGWGTVGGVRLSVLVLSDPERAAAARAIARALGTAHDVTILAEKRGALASHLEAARAARKIAPRLIHAVGARGFGSAAAPIARGVGTKLVVTFSADDLARGRAKKLAKMANVADAVLLEEESLVDPLRSAGMQRNVYILPSPERPEEDAEYFGAIEIVYGRILAGEVEPDPDDGCIVQIGGLRKSPER